MRGVARTLVLVFGALFCVLLALVTLQALLREGFENLSIVVLAGVSLLIVVMILIGLVGAILHPPRDGD
ncbi:hypothetical protein HJD18_00330 [Thermoleophilia bacterium SCSIO 60948]|nr:hypothetical protein HJD18_00330 [Thermoleophilia bacterium SCSIO 60948]